MKIDSHHHFWKYSTAEYPWIGDSMAALRRDFLPEHLQAEIAAAGIDGVVSVQARQSVRETEWLLSMADVNPFIKAVVGWVPLAKPDVRNTLAAFAANPKFRAVRHVVQDEPDDRFVLGADFNRGVSALRDFGLVYDILIFERQLAASIEFVDRHPKQVFVLDHIAKPRIKENAIEPWRKNIRELARRQNVYCKVSGMTTEADYGKWSEEQLRPYFDTVLEAFGPKRLMFGSDWPVCLVASNYLRWVETVHRFAAKLSADEREWLFGKTAVQAYKLKA
ncbi:MAG: amidohydrolase family protein [Chthoniobacteraceae bacterium]